MERAAKSWLIALLLLGGGGAVWYYWLESAQLPPVVNPDVPIAAEVVQASPRYPVIPRQQRSQSELVALPRLDDSDSYFALALNELLGSGMETLLVKSGLIEKFVTTTDNLTSSHVAERVRPLRTPPGLFVAEATDNEDSYTLDPENFKRYEFLVDMLAQADIEQLVDTYRRFYPLFQKAYVNLGYPDRYFNDRVVEVIEHLLAAPEPDGPIRLIRPHVFYEYADPQLESLSSGQKLLLRMGPENALRVKRLLSTMRSRLIAIN